MTTLPFFTGFISKLVRTITLKRIIIWTFTALTAIFIFTLYENRSKLLSIFVAPPQPPITELTFKVGSASKTQIQKIVLGETRLIGVSIFSTDLRLNEARLLYFFGRDSMVSSVFTHAIDAEINRIPLFTSNDDSNLQIIRLINGQFSCVPFDKSLISKIYPVLTESIKTVCKSSIPSYYGYFSGYVEAYISEPPAPELTHQYQLFVEKLANDVYFRDVAPALRAEIVQ